MIYDQLPAPIVNKKHMQHIRLFSAHCASNAVPPGRIRACLLIKKFRDHRFLFKFLIELFQVHPIVRCRSQKQQTLAIPSKCSKSSE